MKMIKCLEEIRNQLEVAEKYTIVIAAPSRQDIALVKIAVNENIANFILVIENDEDYKLEPIKDVEFIKARSKEEALSKAFELIELGKADIPMKGLVQTSDFMRYILDNKYGFRGSGRISQVTVFDGYNGQLQFITDGVINDKLTLHTKRNLIENACIVASYFGYSMPKVALLSSVEVVKLKTEETLDAAILTQMNNRGQLKGCIIDGPLALDNAISLEAAKQKGIESKVAGKADILISPSLVAANMMVKTLVYYANRGTASIIAGTKKPVIMLSRTDTLENKLNTINTALFMLQVKRT